jgi:hypothetical protein
MTKPTPGSKNPLLVAGQLWRMKTGFLHITRVGKTLTEYKLLKQAGQRAARYQLGSHASVGTYLKTNRAKLVAKPPGAELRVVPGA